MKPDRILSHLQNFMPTVLAATLLALFLVFCTMSVPAQNFKHRTVEPVEFEGPVEIVNLEIEGRQALFNDKMMADRDWLKSLNLEFKNIHDKSIVYLEAELEIAPTGKMDAPLFLPLTFGIRPNVPMAELDTKTLKKLAPHKTKKLALSEEMSDFLLKYMREQEIEDIDKVKVHVAFIVFENGVGWSRGQIMRQDIKNPNTWWVDGNWKDRRISSLKNRYDGGAGSPPLPTRQHRSQAISSEPCSQNTQKQIFNYMTVSHKFFPSPHGKFLRSWTSVDDVIPSPTCYYRIGETYVTCGSSPCSGSSLYCFAVKDIIGREGAFGSGGILFNANIPCQRPYNSSTCTCPQSTRQELRVSRTSCTNRPCSPCAAGYDQDPMTCECTPSDIGGGCEGLHLCYEPEVYDYNTCSCVYPSPIIIDTAGDGFHLTTAATDDAWLACIQAARALA